jgi:acetylornithine aminotransferase
MPTYNRLDIAFESGEGVWLKDEAGKRYLDAISGIGVCALGHAHPAVTAAISEQAATLIHTSNLYRIPLQEQLGEKLCALAGMEAAFFANSGAEANEAAIKLARLYGHQQGIDKPSIIVMGGSFHGRTMATLTATGNRKIQAGFEPLLTGFARAPFDDLAAVETIASNNQKIVAVLVEPIQGEGGVNIPDPEYIDRLRVICDHHGWLLMLDEVQTGNGRTGKYFAYQHGTALPDVVTTAKGLGNGLPIGACLVRGKAAGIMRAGSHGSTFGGNPLCSAAALAVINTIESEKLCQQAGTMGDHLLAGLQNALADQTCVKEIRGKGLMLAIELDSPCAELVQAGIDEGVLINVTAGNTIRLLPPLILDRQEADFLVGVIAKLVQQHQGN